MSSFDPTISIPRALTQYPDSWDSRVSQCGQHASGMGVSMGVEVAVPEEKRDARRRGAGARAGRRREGAGGWLMDNWHSPRFIGFALGIALIIAAIIAGVVLLLGGGSGGEGGGGGGGRDAVSSESRFLRRALGA